MFLSARFGSRFLGSSLWSLCGVSSIRISAETNTYLSLGSAAPLGLDMPHPLLDTAPPEAPIYERIGKIASEWAWVELLLAEMLARFCQADPGAMYVVTQSVSGSTMTDWLRTLTQIKVKDLTSCKAILDLLTEIDDARTERNTVVHGVWKAHQEPGFGWVQTMRWDRSEVVKTELWSLSDLDEVIEHIERIQLMLGNLASKWASSACKSEVAPARRLLSTRIVHRCSRPRAP